MVSEFLGRFSYLGFFLLLSLSGLGLPVPEEVPLVAAGVLAGQGALVPWLALAVCFAGVLAGDLTLYAVGRHWGTRALRWRLLRRILTPARQAALTAAYQRHGLLVVAASRLVVGLRTAAFLTAGIARVPLGRFLAVDALASLVSVPLAFGVGYLLSEQVEAALGAFRRVQVWVTVAVLALGAALGLWLHHRRRRERLPGPAAAPRGPAPPSVM